MKANLMHSDHDFDLGQELPAHSQALSEDLDLDVLCSVMANGDKQIFQLAKRALVSSLTTSGSIAYRQEVLSDCLENPSVTRELYSLAVGAVAEERRIWGLYSGSPQLVLSHALNVTRLFLNYLKALRRIADLRSGAFSSPGFTRFFKMISEELDDGYLRSIEKTLEELRFRHGMLISARLGPGNTAIGFVLRRPHRGRWTGRAPLRKHPSYSFEIPARDEGGLQVLDGLRSRGLNLVANALAQSAEHIRSFFTMLASELAFYVGCLNLHDALSEIGAPSAKPEPAPAGRALLCADGLYDICLALRAQATVVGNDLRADAKHLVVVTGANQGGKSTFLRSIGVAQLMMQAGMFVPATRFRANISTGVFTHFKREEDPTMRSGKLDEELRRMSEIAGSIGPGCLLLCNESFSSTNEREGSEIARGIVKAMTDAHVKVVFVTHLFELAHSLYSDVAGTKGLGAYLFLRAERLGDGRRTFRLVEGEPLPTSYGEDSYRRIFGGTPGLGSLPD